MDRWYYTLNNRQRIGPVTTAELKRLFATGALQPSAMVLKEGSHQWIAAATVVGLFPLAEVATSSACLSASVASPKDLAPVQSEPTPSLTATRVPKSDHTILYGGIGGAFVLMVLVLLALTIILVSGVFSSPGRVRVNVTWKNTVEHKLEPDEETIVVLAPAGVKNDLERMYPPPTRSSDVPEYRDECRKKGGYVGVGRGGQVVIENVEPGTYCLVIVSTKSGIFDDRAYRQQTKESMKPFFNSIVLEASPMIFNMYHAEEIKVRSGREIVVDHTF